MADKILIYGGHGGIGGATARLLRGQGHEVHLVARDQDKLAAFAAEIGASFTVGDVTDDAALSRAAEEAAPDDRLAGLVFAVGSINLKPLARLKEEDFLADFRVNALAAAKAIQASAPALKRHGAAGIVLFSSIAANQGFAAHASIAMAKGAVQGLTLSLAAELAPAVRVNCIAPSLVRTDLARALTANPGMADAIAALHPIPRLGEPEDIAALAALLVSPQAGWITGQIIGADGGRSSLRVKG